MAGEGDTSPLGETLSYERLLAAEEPGFEWPELDERSAAAMCYTSGTTGNPKGVVYSHRSTWLHTMAEQSASSVGMTEKDRILIIVPMFHANAWGTPYGAWMAGHRHDHAADVPDGGAAGRHHQRAPPDAGLRRADHLERPAARSTRRSTSRPCGPSPPVAPPCPQSLIEAFEKRFGVTIIQGWGMTETSPLAAFGLPPARQHRRPRRHVLQDQGRAGGRPASRCAWWPRTAPSCPTTASRSGSSRSAGPGSPARTTRTRTRRSSTTAGCAPVTSARSTIRAT